MICNFLFILVDLSLLIDVETEKWWRKKKFIFQGTMHKNRIKNDEKTFQIITLFILWTKKSRAGKIKNNILMHVLYLFWIFHSLLSTEFSRSLEKKNGSSKIFSVFLYPIFFIHTMVFSFWDCLFCLVLSPAVAAVSNLICPLFLWSMYYDKNRGHQMISI